MKEYILFFTVACMFTAAAASAQTTTPGPVERRFTDSLCTGLAKIDMSKITTKSEAVKAYTDCVMQHADMLPDLAAEKKVDMTDQAAMRLVGIELAKNLMKQNCKYFMQLSVAMAKDDGETSASNTTTGLFKRIDLKGFNYIVIRDDKGIEKSFLWFGNFPGSEKFMKGTVALLNKKISITWHDTEAYLPEAKGYYNVKEITGIVIL